MPIYLTAGFVFEDTEHAASLFNLERPGHIYSRISNPTVAAFEERMASLEGGVGAVATASGQAALALAVMTLVGAGGHLVCSAAVYGGTANLLRVTLPRFGIMTTFVPSNDLDGTFTLSSIAVSGQQLFLRTSTHLYCIGAPQN